MKLHQPEHHHAARRLDVMIGPASIRRRIGRRSFVVGALVVTGAALLSACGQSAPATPTIAPKPADAKPLVEKAISIDATNADAHYIYGMTLVAENPAKAKAEFEEFLKLAPTAPNAAIAKSLVAELEKQVK